MKKIIVIAAILLITVVSFGFVMNQKEEAKSLEGLKKSNTEALTGFTTTSDRQWD